MATQFFQIVRTWLRRPGTYLTVVLVWTIGVGLATAAFALADPVIFRQPPFTDLGRLATIRVVSSPDRGGATEGIFPTLNSIRERTDLFTELTAVGSEETVRLRYSEGVSELRLRPVLRGFFDVLGGAPLLRSPDASAPDNFVVVNKDRLPRLPGVAFGSGVLPIVDGGSLFLVGSAAESYFFSSTPRAPTVDLLAFRDFSQLIERMAGVTKTATAIVRLRPGVHVQDVEREMDSRWPMRAMRFEVRSLADVMVGSRRPVALVALALGAVLVVIAALNLGTIASVRASERSKEFLLRIAVGARPRDLVLMGCIEVAALASIAAVLGFFVSKFVYTGILAALPIEWQHSTFGSTNGRMFLVAALLSSVLALGLLAIGISFRRAKGAHGGRRIRIGVVGFQCAAATFLLVLATLFLRSHQHLFGQATHVNPESVIATLRFDRAASSSFVKESIDNVVVELSRLPGLTAVGALSGSLLDSSSTVGGEVRAGGQVLRIAPRLVTPRFFEALEVPLVAGTRLGDYARPWSGVLVNEAFVRFIWPDETPGNVVGRIVRGSSDLEVGPIVGVVADTFERSLDKAPVPALYISLVQPQPFLPVQLAVKLAPTGSAEILPTIRRAAPSAVVASLGRAEDRLAGSVKNRTVVATVVWGAALASAFMSAVGLFGLVAHATATRTREIAIRMSLGASAHRIAVVVLRETLVASSCGCAVGLVLGAWGAEAIRHLLFGIVPGAIGAYFGGVGLLMMVVSIAAWWPTRLALSVAPAISLRGD